MDEKSHFHGVDGTVKANAHDLEADLEWFARVLDARLGAYFGEGGPRGDVREIEPPSLEGRQSDYAAFFRQHEVQAPIRLVILLALIPHVRPQMLDVLWTKNEATQRGFTEFGGAHGTSHGGFVPTGETAVFLLAGDDLEARFDAMRLFDGNHFLARHDVLYLTAPGNGEPRLSGILTLSREYLHRFTTGPARSPTYSSEFPARLISTGRQWKDLVLPEATLAQLEEIKHWVLHGQALLRDWEMGDKLRPGFTSLFHGAPGTGKTLAACLLGKHCGCDVYKVDLSMIVSKYIGETEKNLARVFDMAEHKRWILFFDEADALFGKRTRVEESRDRFANQEVSFLLQRIEGFDGVVILASNLKSNIDDAFLRRLQSIVHFPVPKQAERKRLWTEAFPRKARLEESVNLSRIAEKYDVTGGMIMNVVQYASLMALSRGGSTVLLDDIEEGIRRELLKEGRVL
jgi:ATPase family protein associated with various cellular activities (AAA)